MEQDTFKNLWYLRITQVYKSYKFFIILLIVEIFPLSFTNGRRCYSCSTLSEHERFDCLYNVENIGESWSNNISIVYCSTYCTIRRQEYSDIPGGINYLNRSCENAKLDEAVIGGYFITYLRSCKSDLCNSGDGTTSLKHLPEDEDDEGIDFDASPSNSDTSSASGRDTYLTIKYFSPILISLVTFFV